MSDPWFQTLFADRIGGANYGKGTEIYKFEKIKRAKRKALAEHPERQLLDFGIGENDDDGRRSASAARMAEEINKLENRGYADNGIAAFKEAAAAVHAAEVRRRRSTRRREVNHCIGSKPALAMLPAVLHQPGRRHADDRARLSRRRHAHAVLRRRGLQAAAARPRTASSPTSTASRPTSRSGRSCWSQLPEQPDRRDGARRTSTSGSIDFAQKHQVVVVQDAAHILLSYDGEPLSFLQVDGAKDVGVEVHSMSKGFNMIGWRLGWVCGHARIVQAFADVKDNSDSGQFMAIQHAAAAALDDAEIPDADPRRSTSGGWRSWSRRCKRCGFECEMPGGTYFLYTPSPKGLADGTTFENAEAASQYLITRAVDRAPCRGTTRGAFLRFTVTYEAADEAAEDALMAETESRLKKIEPVF